MGEDQVAQPFKFVPKWSDTSLSSLEWEVSAIEACSPKVSEPAPSQH